MDAQNTVEIKKISEWNRLANVNFQGVFLNLFDLTKAIINLSPLDTIEAGLKLVMGVGSKEKDELDRRAYVLVFGAIRRAMHHLVSENRDLFFRYTGEINDAGTFQDFIDRLCERLDAKELKIDPRFFSHPDQFPGIDIMKPAFEEWMVTLRIPKVDAQHISSRLRFAFVVKLNEVWKAEEAYFSPLFEQTEERFKTDRARGRYLYNQAQIQKWSERMFDESFGLDAVYVPLNGCHPMPDEDKKYAGKHKVVDAETHIWTWLNSPKNGQMDFSTMILRGGPGSGKSSLMKKIAKRLAEESIRPFYFIPLQWFDLDRGIEEGIKGIIKTDEFLEEEDPFDNQAQGEQCNPIFIFDGLDELSRAGTLGMELAKDFVFKLKSMVGAYNSRASWNIRILLTGRDFVIQQVAEPTYKTGEQILELLPYQFVDTYDSISHKEDWAQYEFFDQNNHLDQDKRLEWWNKFHVAKGTGVSGVPKQILDNAYKTLSGQPLLSYLLARSWSAGGLEEGRAANINLVYESLIDSLRTREWGGNHGHKYTLLEKDEFFILLEELAMTAWHSGDVRTTDLKSFEKRCQDLSIGHLLESFDVGQGVNASKLVVAIFARGKGKDKEGVQLVEFTHKSIGEFLVARRLVSIAVNHGRNFQEEDKVGRERVLIEWCRLFSKNRLDVSLAEFLMSEVDNKIKSLGGKSFEIIRGLNLMLIELYTKGIRLDNSSFFTSKIVSSCLQSASFGLLFITNSFAKQLGERMSFAGMGAIEVGKILFEHFFEFGKLLTQCLSYVQFPDNMDFAFLKWKQSKFNWHSIDFRGSQLRYANLEFICVRFICTQADLIGSDFRNMKFGFESANFSDAILDDCNFENVQMPYDFYGNTYRRASFCNANLKSATISHSSYNEDRDENGNYNSEPEIIDIHLEGDELLRMLKYWGAINVP